MRMDFEMDNVTPGFEVCVSDFRFRVSGFGFQVSGAVGIGMGAPLATRIDTPVAVTFLKVRAPPASPWKFTAALSEVEVMTAWDCVLDWCLGFRF